MRDQTFESLDPVEVVLFQGLRPGTSHAVWSNSKVRCVIWYNHPFRSSDRRPIDWVITRRRIDHAALGGVTTGSFTFFMAARILKGAPATKWLESPPECFPNTLSQIWDPTKGGRDAAPPDILSAALLNTTLGLLKWEERDVAVITGPTVYHKERWAKRKLTCKELGAALDFPAPIMLDVAKGNRNDCVMSPRPVRYSPMP